MIGRRHSLWKRNTFLTLSHHLGSQGTHTLLYEVDKVHSDVDICSSGENHNQLQKSILHLVASRPSKRTIRSRQNPQNREPRKIHNKRIQHKSLSRSRPEQQNARIDMKARVGPSLFILLSNRTSLEKISKVFT